MSLVKGMGSCAIPGPNNYPCGKQITEGEPIGTVIAGFTQSPMIGHKQCADAYTARQQEAKMKIGKQQGPGGSIGDPATYDDALAFGSVPLEKEEVPAPDLASVPMPEGVRPLSELPLDDAQAPEPERNIYRDGNHPVSMTDEEREIEAVRRKYAEKRKPSDEPITYTVSIDMTQVPENTQRLQINLDWPTD